ncbi:hypothetical protein EDC49_1944 [Frederiksenia canicola]|uniref:Uncharacterized protein n=1 Tax=Frederiksenia canicola TaxID=123824 RepID=A0ABX9XNR1_9PAST|nr:hypothetical protein EDC49_1944 [Frederiksenia canicola]
MFKLTKTQPILLKYSPENLALFLTKAGSTCLQFITIQAVSSEQYFAIQGG